MITADIYFQHHILIRCRWKIPITNAYTLLGADFGLDDQLLIVKALSKLRAARTIVTQKRLEVKARLKFMSETGQSERMLMLQQSYRLNC